MVTPETVKDTGEWKLTDGISVLGLNLEVRAGSRSVPGDGSEITGGPGCVAEGPDRSHPAYRGLDCSVWTVRKTDAEGIPD